MAKREKSYRKIWIENCGEIPDGYDIHHIDGDRNNNDISNLLALPSELHRKYHIAREGVVCFQGDLFELSIASGMIGDALKSIAPVLLECEKYCSIKADLMMYRSMRLPNVR